MQICCPDLAPGDYRDPGWYQHPPGTVAYEWTSEPLPEPSRALDTPKGKRARRTDLRVVGPRKRRTAANAGGHEHRAPMPRIFTHPAGAASRTRVWRPAEAFGRASAFPETAARVPAFAPDRPTHAAVRLTTGKCIVHKIAVT